MFNGQKYDSKREASEAMLLTALKASKEIKDYKTHVKEELYGQHGTKVATYLVDFVVYHNDGTTEFREVKAKITETSVWRLKWKLLQDKYKNDPNYTFTVKY